MMWRSVLLATMLFSFLPSEALRAQETGWAPGFHFAGLNGSVTTLGTYDGGLVVAGDFVHAGPVRAVGIARWADGSWQAFGEGLSQPAYAIQEYGGHLYAGTRATMYLDRHNYSLIRWTGEIWEPVGEGMPDNEQTSVYAMTEFQGSLIVAGRFPRIGLPETKNIARWDGSTWSALSTGIREPESLLGGYSKVLALTDYHGELIAGGRFEQAGGAVAKNIARWDGMNWRPVGTAVVGEVRQLVVHAGVLFVRHGEALSRWTGSEWISGPAGPGGAVGPLVSSGDALFMIAGNAVLRWVGSSWQGEGVASSDGAVSLTVVFQGEIVVGGSFTEIGGVPARRLAAWRDLAWHALDPAGGGLPEGTATNVWALGTYGTGLVAGGAFTEAGGTPASRIAVWDGSHWGALGPGFNGLVLALAEYRGELIAGGAFTYSGSTQVQRVAAWNGSSWRPLGLGIYTPAGGGYVGTLLVKGDVLYAGGAFSRAGNVDAANVAQWNGTSWASIGGGSNGRISSLAEYNGEVVACGPFSQIGSALGPVARWTGTEWLRVGGSIDLQLGSIEALAVSGGALYAGGYHSNGAYDSPRVFRLSEDQWQELPRLLPVTGGGEVYALAALGDDIVAGGQFREYAMRWTGDEWVSLDRGLNNMVLTLRGGADLFAGGLFTESGRKPAYKVAHWVDSQVPVRLLSFTARWEEGVARVRWEVAGEPADHAGFVLWREVDDLGREPVTGLLTGLKTTNEIQDSGAPPAGCRYMLAEVGRGGQLTWHGPISLGPRPSGFRLLQNHPNPFRTETRIEFEISSAANGELAIFNAAGRKVVTLRSGVLPAGPSVVVWDRRDAQGAPMAAGIYFLRLRAGTQATLKKMVLLPE